MPSTVHTQAYGRGVHNPDLWSIKDISILLACQAYGRGVHNPDLWSTEDISILLAGQAYGRGVHNRHQFLSVLR